ncbi:ATP-binding protein [Geobacter sp. DSM 9736]|uniref:ATP-binding protein n=1 Tax=Geobacter sp. DSM 9736 TaxID=1277350 RepID=UPI000B511E58|nr:ATP-binding protein [Geobacter sp. DSM 9736]SNB45499.1 AAA domain-containing protein [Geobacter sp. DSM 9736]
MAFKKAVRQRAKARIGICGPAGSGKTMSALKLAFGIVGPGGRIALLDTENESASLYAHLGDYDVDVIKPPFTVEKYIGGIREAERLGYDLLIIDSLSHAWAGTGGILEFVDAKAEGKGNKFAGWREATPKHNSLVDAMLQSPMHIIATMRSKTEYILVEDEKGKKVPKKVGMAPVQREGMDYEFSLVFDVDQERHIATSSKDRTEIFDGFFGKLSEEHGRSIREWLDSGEPVQQPAPKPEQGQPAGLQFISPDQVLELEAKISEVGADRKKFLGFMGVKRLEEIPTERMAAAVKALEAKTKKEGTSSNVTDITTALAARRIPFQLNEEAGEVHAKPSYQDSSSKEFLKAKGFKWNPSDKAWVFKQAA